ncbi:family 78 glycoside hydrolase catalytic domain [Nocardioides sp. MAH-18]|uniref:alpha-L-rhamnosidase n=1 Tax=Nocardioides agri TaxID=2682843 RepID=A0A6L6XX99_9ACTN|nr:MULTISPECIES: family 78 glycoside hydrolase catalytic domain [unclassified Nocardioides]MBA2955284.1 family 78 glycoside hydrolase catalytic domain [Nocardioides sp. CGMCC 1.13656]MVQ50135.1 family 78 glycoside hydrolase catalytic domain [Nocardioides sp. MAH-18]
MRVRVEHLDTAFGIGARRPRLSWQLPPGAQTQDAYELALDDGTTTGRVDAPDNVLVAWPGHDLRSGERRRVRVRVWADGADLGWSGWTDVEAGLLDPGDWSAFWIRPDEAEVPRAGERPAYRLRGRLVVDRPVAAARLYVAAHGLHETTLDGERVSDEELAPGYTEYDVHTHVRVHDVHLTRGPHTIEALLADGWYRGKVGAPRASDQWGDRTAYLAQLVVEHEDGSVSVHGTGPDWEWTTSHVVAADLIDGQVEDRRLLGSPDWRPVVVDDRGHDALTYSPAPPVRPVEDVTPIAVTAVRPGVQVVDLGQNINGHVRLSALGPEGTELTLTHGEALGPDGDVTMDHLVPALPFLPDLTAGQVDRVVSAGVEGDLFEPRFTTHGFRYVRIEGDLPPVSTDDVAGVVVHTDLVERGGFACSDPRLDKLHLNAVWSFRGNACDVPTDCPTRERAGWTGDWQLYIPTASYLYDVAGFSLKWLRDLVVTQWADGTLNNMAPMPKAERTGFLEKMNGSAGWGDAILLVPWEMYGEYGDVDVLAETWPAMVRWLDRMERMAATDRHPDRVAAHPEPRPHDRFLWDTGFHWGEWLEPGGHPGDDFPAFVAKDKAEVATAFYAWSTRHAAEVARVLDDKEAADRYDELSRAVVAAWQAEFVDGSGRITPHTQANLVRALRFDLVPETLRQRTADYLAALVRAAGVHVGTGFLATPDLLPMLAEHGHLDLAYELLMQDTSPSWLAMVDRGATTVWELWDGIDADGVPHESLSHYSKGAVVSFLHRYTCGLQRTAPTWRTFRVAPQPGAGLTWARTHHDSPHGRISVAWARLEDVLTLDLVVPPGCTAEVVLPSGTTERVGPGAHVFTG